MMYDPDYYQSNTVLLCCCIPLSEQQGAASLVNSSIWEKKLLSYSILMCDLTKHFPDEFVVLVAVSNSYLRQLHIN